MKQVGRKYEAINLMKLYSLGSANGWNEILTDCYRKQDINRLAKIRYQIAAGMDDLVKQKLNTEEMILWFIRLNRSLEITAKKIVRQKYPLPNDNPLATADFSSASLEAKRKRDHELAVFFKNSSY